MIDITVYEENKFIDIIIEEDLKQILKKYKALNEILNSTSMLNLVFLSS